MMINCVFCEGIEKIIFENCLAYSRWDKHPVSEGHALIIPKRHVETLRELFDEEVIAFHDILGRTRSEIDKLCSPDGYNYGINEGRVAGQTVSHLHMHVIPRYKGDVEDPVGGVRKVIPCRGHR